MVLNGENVIFDEFFNKFQETLDLIIISERGYICKNMSEQLKTN